MATTPITIEIPKSNRADDWNAAVKEGADKAGVTIPEPGAAAAAATKKEDDVPTILETSITVNGQDIVVRDADPAKLIEKLSAAVQAAQAAQVAPAAAAAVAETPKPAFTEAELFDIGMKLQKGDVSGIETFLEKSDILDRLLKKRGLDPEKLNASITAQQDADLQERWKEATDKYTEKIKAGDSDFPGGPQNVWMMGIMLAELGLREKPSVESFDKAYALMKERNLVFPVTKTEAAAAAAVTTEPKKDPPKKAATSSTAVGTHGKSDGGEGTPRIDPSRKFELDMTKLTPREYAEAWNKLMAAGVKPEQVKIIQ